MDIDVRIPMGMMFSMAGAVLLAFGLASRADLFAKSFGMNVDLWWGAVVLVFGLMVLNLGRSGQGRIEMSKKKAKAGNRE